MNCYDFIIATKELLLEILEYDLYRGTKWEDDYD